MKTITRILSKGLSNTTALAVLSVCLANAQNTLQFTSANTTSENAIQLHWASNTNEVYRIEYADQLAGNEDGSTAWNILYEDYPSHGTNSFVADAGNYDVTPTIGHPQSSPMRFYRVMLEQANTIETNPIVSVMSPTNGATLTGDITVSIAASTPDILSEVKLYVDGEEQWTSIDGTNFVINTCEWPNGSHVLFATAKSQSGFAGAANGAIINYGRSVSSYRNVNFDNLISKVKLSEPFFEPALGQTQNVTAAFAQNSDWTLTIKDKSENPVRIETGTGNSLSFLWDGTGTGETNIPDGVYSYEITAATNGASSFMSMSSMTMTTEETASTYITSEDGSMGVLPLAIFPPSFDTNGLIVFEATPSEVQSLVARPARSMTLSMMESSSASTSSLTTPSSQTTKAPKRKPRVGVKGAVGSFGICYKTYGTNGFSSQHPLTGWPFPLPTRVAIDGQTATATTVDQPIPSAKPLADGFSQVMQQAGWKAGFVKANDQWGANDIKKASLGGNSIFNNCNFGLMLCHGSFANNSTAGNSSDSIRYTYVCLGNNNFVKLSEMDFGSDGTNGLRWMTMLLCNILKPENYSNMNNHNVIPVNASLHLLLGFSTTGYSNNRLGKYYANYMVNTNQTVINSLANACADTYAENSKGITNIVRVGITGYTSCWGDSLSSYNDPDGNALDYQERTVFIP